MATTASPAADDDHGTTANKLLTTIDIQEDDDKKNMKKKKNYVLHDDNQEHNEHQHQHLLRGGIAMNDEETMIEFMIQFKQRASEYISNAYEIDHTVRISPKSGVLRTSLVEDVVSLIEMQYDVLVDAINNGNMIASNVMMDSMLDDDNPTTMITNTTMIGRSMLVDGLYSIFNDLRQTQNRCRHLFTTSLKDACAAANDFHYMSYRIEQFIQQKLEQQHPFFKVADYNRKSKNCCDYEDDGEAQEIDSMTEMSEAMWLLQLGYDIVTLYSRDAVYAAERAHVYIMQSIRNHTFISTDLFSVQWEDDWTSNQVMYDLTIHINQYLVDAKVYLTGGGGSSTPAASLEKDIETTENEFLYQKLLVVTVKAVVCLYVRCIIEKADSVARRRKHRERRRRKFLRRHNQAGQLLFPQRGNNNITVQFDDNNDGDDDRRPFRSAHRALVRMAGDISILVEYFRDMTKEQPFTLWRIIQKELDFLILINEVLSTTDHESLDGFVLVLHQRTGADPLVTRYFVSDLCRIFDNQTIDRYHLKETLKQLQPDLHMVTKGIKERAKAVAAASATTTGSSTTSDISSYVCLDQMLRVLYEDRLTQGIMPCYHFLCKEDMIMCVGNNGCNSSLIGDNCCNSKEYNDDAVVVKQLRYIARNIPRRRDDACEQIRTLTGHIKKDVMPKIRSTFARNTMANLRTTRNTSASTTSRWKFHNHYHNHNEESRHGKQQQQQYHENDFDVNDENWTITTILPAGHHHVIPNNQDVVDDERNNPFV